MTIDTHVHLYDTQRPQGVPFPKPEEQAAIQPAPLDAAYYAPVFDVVWAVFGPDRLAYGSNWPPCLNVGDYRGTVDLARDSFRAKGADALAKVMGRNAAAFYGGPGFSALPALGDA